MQNQRGSMKIMAETIFYDNRIGFVFMQKSLLLFLLCLLQFLFRRFGHIMHFFGLLSIFYSHFVGRKMALCWQLS